MSLCFGTKKVVKTAISETHSVQPGLRTATEPQRCVSHAAMLGGAARDRAGRVIGTHHEVLENVAYKAGSLSGHRATVFDLATSVRTYSYSSTLDAPGIVSKDDLHCYSHERRSGVLPVAR